VDYFSSLLNSSPEKDPGYHIPISFHPDTYDYPLQKQRKLPRINSAFFCGAFDADTYRPLRNNSFFQTTDRMRLLSLLNSKFGTCTPESFDELAEHMNKSRGREIIIIQSQKYCLPQELLIHTLSAFDFFIAFPGAHMPLSHNLTEALFCETIPIIQKSYANLLSPVLVHRKTALVFDSEKEIHSLLTYAFDITQEEKENMRSHIRSYYQNHLEPHRVVEKILSAHAHNQPVYLLGSKNSE
jgi:hypothetical protein